MFFESKLNLLSNQLIEVLYVNKSSREKVKQLEVKLLNVKII